MVRESSFNARVFEVKCGHVYVIYRGAELILHIVPYEGDSHRILCHRLVAKDDIELTHLINWHLNNLGLA